jgi:tRNA modification GTPase
LEVGSKVLSGSDTIYALSSGAGKSGVAVVRVSGSRAGDVVRKLCGELPEPRKAVLRTLRALSDGATIDRAIVVWFPAPHSFTGEDVAEFHVHGSAGVVRWLCEELSDHGGSRPGEAGEFSRRAFLNGKLDLVEIEGLGDVLEAETRQQVKQALFHVNGQASEVFARWRSELVRVLALVEACIDFSDEEGVEASARPEIASVLQGLRTLMAGQLSGVQRGRRVRQGARVVLAGGPNAGKSSLMNAVAARDVAIVSRHAGTTRDVVEVSLDLGGHAVELADTAGIRDARDSEVEELGIQRSLQRIGEADLVLLVGAPDVPWPEVEFDSEAIRIWNKCDLPGVTPASGADMSVSAHTGAGLKELLRLIEEKVSQLADGEEPALLVRDRQIFAVRECIGHLDNALEDWLPFEIVAEEVRSAARVLEKLVGKIDVEDLLDDIFSRFCIGK